MTVRRSGLQEEEEDLPKVQRKEDKKSAKARSRDQIQLGGKGEEAAAGAEDQEKLQLSQENPLSPNSQSLLPLRKKSQKF